MSEQSDSTLSYGRSTNALRRHFGTSQRTKVLIGIITVTLFLAFGYVSGPTSCEIRLDTGDLRYLWFGVPLRYDSMAEPERSKLMGIAVASPGHPAIPATWATCPGFPPGTTNNPDAMYKSRYEKLAVWIDEDPHIARWAIEDTVASIQRPGTGFPAYKILKGSMIDWDTESIKAGWRDRQEVKEYCAAHGYTPPPPAPPR